MHYRLLSILFTSLFISGCGSEGDSQGGEPYILRFDDFRHYVEYFNRMEDENVVNAVPNAQAWEWMTGNIPLFECPQDNFEEIYYYRWWTIRKHIKETPVGYILTEFLVDRSYADKYNMISCALGHHIYEMRWIHDPVYLDDYIHAWYRGNDGGPMERLRKFSSWTADAIYNRYLVNGNQDFLLGMAPDLEWEYRAWESDHRLGNGLFWQYDVRDGMEEQISGSRHEKNARPTINSYMAGNAVALGHILDMAGKKEKAQLYYAKADTLKALTEQKLWNPGSAFFEALREDGNHARAREAIGFIPWYFHLPSDGFEQAWSQLMDPEGFLAPFGLTTAERRHPEFRTHGCCNCEWDGAVWPFATSQTLTALANLLNDYQQSVVSAEDYFKHMELYVESQYYRGRPYIGEYLDERTGYWLKGDQERSRFYNHSTFNDLIITGLVGLRPSADDVVEVNPLIPSDRWDWFCLDNVLYHGRIITILWDRDGTRYNKGKGFFIYADGREIASSDHLTKLSGKLKE
ncbi:MAG: hypothetical protein JXR52_05570 [Bacteroidales bacterium]|nr:hypothetical protein [Bacteroidales bacterium]